MFQKTLRALNKVTPVARKEGDLFYAELQGIDEQFILKNDVLLNMMKRSFKTNAEAIMHGRKIIDTLKESLNKKETVSNEQKGEE